MNEIIYDNIIYNLKNHDYVFYHNLIGKLKPKDRIKLALFCAKYSLPYNSVHTEKFSQECMILIEKKLKYYNNRSRIKEKVKNKIDNIENQYRINYNLRLNQECPSIAYYAFKTAYEIKNIFYCLRVFNISKDSNEIINFSNILKTFLLILLRTSKQYNINIHNNQHYEYILKEIIKSDIDKLELIDWNMLCDISQEYYNIKLEFNYEDIFSRRSLIELLRREYSLKI